MWRKNRILIAVLVLLLPLLASCGGEVIQIDAKAVTPPPVSKDKITKVLKELEQINDMPAVSNACVSTLVPSKGVSSGYAPGKCSDDPSKCLNECRDGNGGSCYALAVLIEKNDDTTDQPDKLHLKACGLGIVSGCTNSAARMLERQPEDKGVQLCTADTVEKTCALDDLWGCTMYAMVLSEGTGREKDLNKALEMAGKACKYGDEEPACVSAKNLISLIERIRKPSRANLSNQNN